jgi:hypothetical protein
MRPGADVETWEAEIQDGLKAIPDRALAREWSDPRWTREVKRVVGDIGTRHGFAVCASGWPKIFDDEWLFDLVWYKNDKDNHLVSVPLVLESEWSLSFEAVKYDFEKLLVAKAQLRILVHQARTKAAVDDAQRKLITLVSKFEGSTKGDRYLFAGYDFKTTEFLFRSFTY